VIGDYLIGLRLNIIHKFDRNQTIEPKKGLLDFKINPNIITSPKMIPITERIFSIFFHF